MWVKLACRINGKLGIFMLGVVFDYYYYQIYWFLMYYLKRLKITKDYYGTLSALNSNKFCPDGLSGVFIEEVQKQNLMPV